MKQIKKKGFTLIELLVTIAIISLILLIGTYFVFNVFYETEEIMDEISKKMILKAAEQYSIEFRTDELWNEEIDEFGNAQFCVTLESLINYGYFDNKKDIIKYKNSGYIVEMSLTNGIYSSLLTTRENISSKCQYFLNKTTLSNGSGSIDIEENNSKLGTLEYNVEKIDNDNYNTNIDFNVTLEKKHIEKNVPVYVALIIDNSGSMNSNSKFENAKEAAINLSNNIINTLDNSYIALVQYTDKPTLNKGFESTSLQESDFNNPGGNTNTSGGIDMTSSLFKEIKDNNAMLYTILLYDGEPTHYASIKYNGSTLYSTSNNENYFTNFKTSDIYTNTCSTTTCITHIISSSNYLKNTINSKLITIGYDFSSNEKALKITSSQDNDFCKDADYVDIDTSETNLLSNVVGDLVQTTSVYNFKVDDDGALISTNEGVANSVSGSVLKIDLTNKGNYTLTVDSSINSSTDDNFGYIYLERGLEKIYYNIENKSNFGLTISGRSCNNGRITGYNMDSNNICYSGQSNNNIVTFNLESGLVYNLRFEYQKNGYTIDTGDYFKINKITLTPKETTTTAYEEITIDSDLTLSNGYDTVVPFKVEDEKLVSNNKSVDFSQSYGYELIDLTSYSGKYILQVNNSISSTNKKEIGFVIVNENDYSPYITSNFSYSAGANGGHDNHNNNCNSLNQKCISGVYDGKNYYFELEGGKKYYVHFIYNISSYYSYGTAKHEFTINNLKLYKVSDSIYSGAIPLESDIDNIKQLTTIHEYGFIDAGNGAIVSTNAEIDNSYSNSYNEIDLTSYSLDDYISLTIDVTISSEKEYDLGNIAITESSEIPTLTNNSCAMTSGIECLGTISGSIAKRNLYAMLQGGKKYYLHYIYVKNSSSYSGNDNFIINSISLNNASLLEETSFPIENKTYFTNIVDGINYNFINENGKYVSTNGNTQNTLSHSYVKLDLTNYSSLDKYKVRIYRDISSPIDYGYGYTAITKSAANLGATKTFSFPDTDSFNGIECWHFIEDYISGNSNNVAVTDTMEIPGGEVYYLHFIYARGDKKYTSTKKYDWKYAINNIVLTTNVIKYTNLDDIEVVVDNFNNLDNLYIPLQKKDVVNYSFKIDDNNYYVNENSNADRTSFAHAYVKIDLSNYQTKKDYYVKVGIIPKTEYYNKNETFNLVLTKTTDIPRLNEGILNTSGDYSALYLVNGAFTMYNNLDTNEYYLKVSGGETYYLHMLGNIRGTYYIKSINVYNDTSKYYCYYDSTSTEILNIFNNVSNKIIDKIDTTKAKKAKIILTPGKTSNGLTAFNLVDNDGNIIDNNQIIKEIDLTEYINGNTNSIDVQIKDTYKLKINNEILNEVDKEEYDITVDLFKITVIFSYDENYEDIKEYTIPNVPKVSINSNRVITIN